MNEEQTMEDSLTSSARDEREGTGALFWVGLCGFVIAAVAIVALVHWVYAQR